MVLTTLIKVSKDNAFPGKMWTLVPPKKRQTRSMGDLLHSILPVVPELLLVGWKTAQDAHAIALGQLL